MKPEVRARRWVAAWLLVVVSAVVTAAPRPQSIACQPAGPAFAVPGIPELSGLAAGRTVSGRIWAHNDSGRQTLFALDVAGAMAARVTLTGRKLVDWEAVAVGPCPSGSCVYVADIGDNAAMRRRVAVYRLPEPSPSATSAALREVFYGTYPDGPRDAETLLVTPEGRLYIVSKGEDGPVALYRFPASLRAGQSYVLERVGEPRSGPKTARADRVTDGSVSADGRWVVLRTASRLTFHHAENLFAGRWDAEHEVDLAGFKEPQGEAVAFGEGGAVYIGGEGDSRTRAGTFARLACSERR